VLIAGAGMAGLAAAVAAAGAGARVLVAEKRADVGGQAAISAGAIWAPPTVRALREYVPDGDARLQELLVERLPGDLQWLAGHDLPLSTTETLAGFGAGRVMQGGVSGDHHMFMNDMAHRALALGASLRCCAHLVRADASSYDGTLRVELADGSLHRTRALILATGGFQGNAAVLKQHLGVQAASALVLRGLAESTGDGLRIALSLGATYGGDMSAFYGHTMPDCTLPPDRLQPLTPYFARFGVLVNRAGQRFVDEADALLEEVNPQLGCLQPGGRYWLIFDRTTYEAHGINQHIISGVPTIDRLTQLIALGAPVHEAPTLEALAAALAAEGLDGAQFLATMHAYNSACRTGLAASLATPRIRNALPVEHAPLYAMRCVPGITNTCGGVKVDVAGRALGEDGRPVPGVFAAGVDAGGVFGRHYAGFLAWALVSGRHSGYTAVAEAEKA
jgi:succinate dehydrogenase/fumarate reductase flavoprotein subunit